MLATSTLPFSQITPAGVLPTGTVHRSVIVRRSNAASLSLSCRLTKTVEESGVKARWLGVATTGKRFSSVMLAVS